MHAKALGISRDTGVIAAQSEVIKTQQALVAPMLSRALKGQDAATTLYLNQINFQAHYNKRIGEEGFYIDWDGLDVLQVESGGGWKPDFKRSVSAHVRAPHHHHPAPRPRRLEDVFKTSWAIDLCFF